MLLFLLMFAAAAAKGQEGGRISGRVSSPIRQPLAGVVILLSSEGKEALQTISDREGRFVFEDLDAGTYRLLLSYPGYEEQTVENLEVTSGEETKLELSMSLPRITESIVIRDVAPPEEPPTAAPPKEIRVEQLDLLPLATDRFQDAFPLLPGVVRDPEGRLSFNGSRPSQSILLVNGANVTDPVTGDFAVELPLRAVEEVEVHDLPYSAEYGRVTAAVAEVKTRGGTDEWDLDTGDLLPKINFRDGKIRGIKAFVPQIGVSGPLRRGKLWISQGLAYRFVRTRVYDIEIGEDERELESYDSFTQVDWRISDQQHLTTTFSYFPGETDNLGLNALNTAASTPEFHSTGWNAAVSGRSMFSDALFEATVAMKNYNLSLRPKGEGRSLLTPDGLRENYFHNLERDTSRIDFLASLTYPLAGFFGPHQLKAGGGVARSRFDGIDRGLPLDVVDASGALIRRVAFLGDPSVSGSDAIASLFLQDRWRIGERLGVEVGLRYDYDDLVSDHQIVPRLAVAYAFDALGRSVLRGGAGVFYDHVHLHAAAFERFQTRVETSFGPGGEPAGNPLVFEHRIAPEGLDSPRSATWNVELDRVLAEGFQLRVGYRERHGSKEMIVDRLVEGDRGTLLLSSRGASVSRELGLTLRIFTREDDELFLAYSNSRSTGDLNDLGTLYRNLRPPLLYENEQSVLDLDVPHRFLLWGTWRFPGEIEVGPGFEWRSGFPYTVYDESYLPVGPRNRSGRFPAFFSFDIRVTRRFTVKGRNIRLGVQLFNVGDHFNPRDVVSNLGSPRFGQFLNGVDMGVGLRFSLEK